ncbi:carbon-nitrogen hydrolase family protein [Massilia sp. W12]|uniref:carbon-nitrogen hydrolase family protein n=1 Tax=Massilia sp. W12 TaxID=3126507 RepID=UPI0030CD6D55
MMKVAAVQMVSGVDVARNIARAQALVAQAAGQGAQLVLLPEYWAIMGQSDRDKVGVRETLGGGPIQDAMQEMARRHGVWLAGGTLPLSCDDPGKVFNSTLVFNPAGERVARYDKIHLFGFKKDNEAYDEAQTIVPGRDVATVETPAGKTGLAVCYDLRFPELFRAAGDVKLWLLSAAFTWTTGSKHWETLLRARAIENQCYVLASAQGGTHENGRRTWGHSMLIDPWGDILACVEEGEGVAAGEFDLQRMAEVRSSLPALQHRRL